MGKQLQRVDYGVQLKNRPPPGCFWGMFHVLDYHHWNYVKKLLHHKKHHGRRRLQCFAAPKTSSFSYHHDEEEEHINDESQHLLGEHRVDLNPSSFIEISDKNRPLRKHHQKDSISDGTNPIIILHEKCNQERSGSEHNSSKNGARFTKARSFPVPVSEPFGSGRYRPGGTLDHKQNEVWFFPRGEKFNKIVTLEGKEMKESGPALKAANHHGWNRLITSQFKGLKKIIRRALKETKETRKVSEVAAMEKKIQQMTRLSSLNESMDKYAWLFERSDKVVGGDVPKSYRRRHSLPDYETLISLLGEVSQETLYSGLLTWTKSEIDKSKELIKPPPFDIKGDQTDSASRSDSMKKPLDLEGSDVDLSIEMDNEPTWSDNRKETVFESEKMESFNFHTKAVVEIENKAPDQAVFSSFEGPNFADPVKWRDNLVKEDDPDFKFVTDILKSAGFFETESIPSWDLIELPLNPQLFDELEAPKSHGLECLNGYCAHELLFDLINEALLEIYNRSFSYFPRPISKGKHVLDEVWKTVKGYSTMWSGFDPSSLDDVVYRDMAKRDGWMSLEWDSECLALELEDSILNDIIDDLIYP